MLNTATKQTLQSMGFHTKYIDRALEECRKNDVPTNDISFVTEIIVRLQREDEAKISRRDSDQDQSQAFVGGLTAGQASNLEVNDIIDHRDNAGRFLSATIKDKQGSNLKIHYNGWSTKWDTWSDYNKELYRFAKAGSISKRPAHKFKELKKGDYVNINPVMRHPGWKAAIIRKLDGKSGQIYVCNVYLSYVPIICSLQTLFFLLI